MHVFRAWGRAEHIVVEGGMWYVYEDAFECSFFVNSIQEGMDPANEYLHWNGTESRLISGFCSE